MGAKKSHRCLGVRSAKVRWNTPYMETYVKISSISYYRTGKDKYRAFKPTFFVHISMGRLFGVVRPSKTLTWSENRHFWAFLPLISHLKVRKSKKFMSGKSTFIKLSKIKEMKLIKN